jgi:acyl-coenzyme A synthetase/AMP-(fatty) acid ligase
MQHTFENIINLIATEQFNALESISIHKPQHFNWVEEVFENIHVAQQPENTALLWTDGNNVRKHSFKAMQTGTNQLLNLWRDKGVQQGDIMLTLLGLQEINWYALLAAIKGGLRIIPAATILGTQDIVYRCKTMMPKIILSDLENAAKIEEAEQILQQAFDIKILAEGSRPGWISVSTIENYSHEAKAASTRPDDVLFLFFTSGTTGLPKIVMHTHFSYPVGSLTTASWVGLKPGDIHCNISQPGWAKFAWSSFFAPWICGATIFAFAQQGRFVAPDMLKQLALHKITTFCAPPTVLRLLVLEDLKAYQFSFRSCVAAGEPLNPEIIDIWKQNTGVLIRDGFGQTESTCMVANLPNSKVKFGAMGKPTFLYDVVIADDDGNILPDNEEGNICVRTNTNKHLGIFSGYYQDEEKMHQVFKHNLYYTGDKAYRDQEGYIWFVGRNDDVIKSSDYRVGPFEVESVVLEHEAVQESAVIGSPHAVKGFVVKAYIILKEGITPDETTARSIFEYTKAHIAPYKMPRIIEFVTTLPKTISGKIRRVELRAQEAENKAKNIKGVQEYFL